MSLLAIITGILTLVNYAFLTGQIYPVFIGVFLQAVLTIVTFMTALAYRGRRQRRDYVHGGYKIFTLRFGIIMVSCLGNLAVLIVILLNLFGRLNHF
ncbi:hypothetical protein AB0Y04_06250 [Loigolactobacillus coryniformis]|jgi:hypothetical protein|uniref:Uncharacterized protein n=2 Tax=Loigolactobacillus coryniformis TaxID=1610 RepID=A0A0R1ET87_9LACO|nr:hypothetical protein [Loigolactobacillus coryniformis]MDT3391352.1 hypothetical protein [Bacillota bacterium]OEH89492.1 hypothetical protein ATO00_10690 [Loigolactobacillus coryniformis subsp. coryniformis]ATO54311.1 hypothetical protein LC20001_01115 [Loigolactobacillus coryniformis subsp. coryniformis KCTC 3167 = DSM 20001]KRK12383.1 hypothetical protein FD22_GL000491 [Loigolactobacillus coryniformis subsp. coryniformis KCTC 3167 = DSM 20001]MCL5457090.1 hypothetical protein [Loigolactoba